MRSKAFYGLITARLISLLGDEIFSIAFPLFIYHQTKSIQQFSFSFAIEISIYMIFSLFGGAIADRFDLKKTIMWIDGLSFLTVIGFGYLMINHFSLGLAYGCLVILSILSAIYNVSFDKIPIQYLEGQELSKTLSYFQSMREFSKIVGAPLGATLFLYTGIQGIFAVNALSFITPFIAVLFLKNVLAEKKASDAFSISGFFKDSVAGFTILWANHWLRMVTILAVFLNIILAVHYANWAILYKIEFNVGERYLGFVQSACAVFFIIASLAAGRYIGSDLKKCVFSLVLAQVAAIFGSIFIFSAPHIFIAVVGSVLMSVANAFHGLPSTIIRKEVTEINQYGKVLAAARVISRLLAPVSITVAALLIPYFTIKQIMLFSGILCFVFSIIPVVNIIGLKRRVENAPSTL